MKTSKRIIIVGGVAAAPVRQRLEKNGVSVALGNGVAGFESGPNGAIVVNTKSGA
jgi:hypothetical protein